SCYILYLRFITLLFPFFFHDPPTTQIYTLSLHDALPIYNDQGMFGSRRHGFDLRAFTPRRKYRHERREPCGAPASRRRATWLSRSEEHTSELQSRVDLVCRLLLEKKNTSNIPAIELTGAI